MTSAFGASARQPPSRGRRPAPEAPCPCGVGTFGQHCGPILDGGVAATAEALMRSRYTAFALADAAHLRSTWHPSTAPDDLDLDEDLRWEGLQVEEAVNGRAGDRRGTVAFRARWRDIGTGERGELRERSRFLFQRDRWWYLDGEL